MQLEDLEMMGATASRGDWVEEMGPQEGTAEPSGQATRQLVQVTGELAGSAALFRAVQPEAEALVFQVRPALAMEEEEEEEEDRTTTPLAPSEQLVRAVQAAGGVQKVAVTGSRALRVAGVDYSSLPLMWILMDRFSLGQAPAQSLGLSQEPVVLTFRRLPTLEIRLPRTAKATHLITTPLVFIPFPN